MCSAYMRSVLFHFLSKYQIENVSMDIWRVNLFVLYIYTVGWINIENASAIYSS